MDGRPNVEIKLRFRDGLVWTVGLTVEIKLRFHDGLVHVDGSPNVRNKAALSNYSGVVWALPKTDVS